MASQDERPAVIRVGILEGRRLHRQALSIWLAGQNDVELAATGTTATAILQSGTNTRLDVVIVGMDNPLHPLMAEAQAVRRRRPNVKMVAITPIDEAAHIDQLFNCGFKAVVPSSATANDLLRVIRAGSVVRSMIARPNERQRDFGPLTAREAEVLSLVGRGSTTYDISAQLGISRSTVANHKERIFTKLQAKNQAHAVARAVSLGLIAPGREEDPVRAS